MCSLMSVTGAARSRGSLLSHSHFLRDPRACGVALRRYPVVFLHAPSSFLRRQESTQWMRASLGLVFGGDADTALVGRRNIAARTGAGGRLGSCLRRNDGEGARRRDGAWVLGAARYPRRSAGMTDLGGRVRREGVRGWRTWGRGCVTELGGGGVASARWERRSGRGLGAPSQCRGA